LKSWKSLPGLRVIHFLHGIINEQELSEKYFPSNNIRIDAVGPEWLMAGGYVTGTDSVTLTAYNSSDILLGAVSTIGANTVGYGTPNIFLNVSAPNIAYVEFSILSGNTFTVDDFTFNPVPIPAAVLLGMLGLGVAGLKLRKFK